MIHGKAANASVWLQDLKLLIKYRVLLANVVPVFTGFWLALYFTGSLFGEYVTEFFCTMIGTTLVMAGALMLNNWYEADIDAVMDRTKQRPTVTGHFSLRSILAAGILTSLSGFGILLFTTGETIVYTFIGWFAYVVLYTIWSKRRYTMNTIIGSLSGAVTPLMGWAAVDSALHVIPISLFAILFIWQIPHTLATAMKKCDEYSRAGVRMLPVVYGFAMTKRQMAVYVACLLPIPFWMVSLGNVYVFVLTVLNIAWLGLVLYGFYAKDDLKWAHQNFLFSVNYLMVVFLLPIILTIPSFLF